MSEPSISIRGAVATLRLNRPGQRNRLESTDQQRIIALCEEINMNQDVRVLVLEAQVLDPERPVFSAGYDLSTAHPDSFDLRLFEQMVDTVARLRPVSVAHVNGSVYGGATDLVLACDLRLGLDRGVWQMPATKFGLHYYGSGLQRYVATMGLARAKRAFLTAQPIAFIDLADLFVELLPAAQLDERVSDLVTRLASLPLSALVPTKQSLNELAIGESDPQVLLERELRSIKSPEFASGLAAFHQKHPKK